MPHFIYLLLILTGLQAAPTPDTTFHWVSYFEVMPSSAQPAEAALKQYRDMSRKDEGSIRIELFEQTGRAGHFSIIEAWRDQKAHDAHRMAAHTKELLSKLQPIRLSDHDQRPYKTLSTGSAPAASDRTIYVISHVDVGGQSDAPNLLRRLAEASRKDEGNLRFDVLQHAMRANHFTVVETWQNQKALDAHAVAAHTRQYRDALQPLLGSPLDERLYKVVE